MRLLLLSLLSLLSFPSSAQVGTSIADDGMGNLSMGHTTSWNARLLFNAEGGYSGNFNNIENPVHGWEKLYEAQAGDVYTVSMPTAALDNSNARLQFKSTINITATHSYQFRITLTASHDIPSSQLTLSENDDDNNVLTSRTFSLKASVPYKISTATLTGKSISDLKFELTLPTLDDNVTITIADIHLLDVTTGSELWTGTSFFNWCYYANPATNARIKDMAITGRQETMSWTKPDFDDSQWQLSPMPLGNIGAYPEPKTIWQGADNTNYWIRRNFRLDKVVATTRYLLTVNHDDSYRIYVNGNLLDEDLGWTTFDSPNTLEVPARFLREGNNVIATYIQQNWGGRYFDCGMSTTLNYFEEADTDVDLTKLQINEVQVANIDQYIDYSYNYGSWIEIHNNSDKRISLDNLCVSDDATNLRKFIMPSNSGVVPAHGYKLIYFDHNISDGNFGDMAFRQVAFKLNAEGGTVYLSDYEGTLISQVTYPAAISRCSYALQNDAGSTWGYTGEPTPGATNATSMLAAERLSPPSVDTDSRLFTDAFTVTTTIPAGATLRYTIDGSTPTLTNGATSNDGTFQITSTTTLRLALFQHGLLPSKVVTRSYIKRDNDYYLPVISITTAPDNLYNDSIGIYVDGTNGIEGRNHGMSNINMDWERPVNFEYITPDNTMAVNQEAEFTISGGWSRHYHPSSFKIKASRVYEGLTSIDCPFFPHRSHNKYKQILVRNGGNDNDSQQHGRVRDAITQSVLISSGFYVDCQDYQPVQVFFNGSYIGQFNLREPNNRYHGTANYGYDDDNMDAFEYSNGYFQKAGTRESFDNWLSLSRNATDDSVYDQICNDIVDIDEFANFWAAVTYIGCSDWINNNNNLKGYRSRDNGKYRLTLHDQDWGWNNSNNILTINGNYGNDILAIYNNMLRNPRFRRQLIDAYCIVGGSVFTPSRCEQIGDSICRLVAPALAIEGKEPWLSFNEQRSNMTSDASREARMESLRQAFGLDRGMKMSIHSNIPQASFLINRQPVPLNRFYGTLFSPVSIAVSAPAGYNFVGWEKLASVRKNLFVKGDSWKYWDGGSLDGTDWKTGTISSWHSSYAPLGYGKTGINTIINYGSDASNKRPTYYFRRNVTLSDSPQSTDRFTLNWTADDGFILYVNGKEAYRHLMPDGSPTYDTYSTGASSGNPDSGSFDIDPSLMRQGTNIIAVEVHNNSATSTDIYWDAELVAVMAAYESTISANRQLDIATDEDMMLRAVFEPIDRSCLIAAGSTPVVINEISAGNSIFVNDYYKKNDWIELYNTTSNDIDISGMYLSDNLLLPEKYKISAASTDASTVIPAHGYMVVWADRLSPITQLHSDFRLENSDQQHVILTAADRSWADTLTYSAHTGEQSVGRYPDGGKRVYTMSKPTILAPNFINTSSSHLYGEDVNFDEEAYLTGVGKLTPSENVGTEYFTIGGIRINSPQRGINIVRTTEANGNVTTRRIKIE